MCGETWVQSLDQDDPLEKEMATHSNILVWRIPWTEELVGLQSMGLQRVRHDDSVFLFAKCGSLTLDAVILWAGQECGYGASQVALVVKNCLSMQET